MNVTSAPNQPTDIQVNAESCWALGRLGEPSTASAAAWAAAGAAVRELHDAPPPPWPGRSLDDIAAHLDKECDWLLTNDVLPADLVTRNRRIAEVALRPAWSTGPRPGRATGCTTSQS